MRSVSFILFVFISINTVAQDTFDRYFTDKVLRFDYILAGNSSKTTVYPVEMKEEALFGGSKTQLTDPFGYGNLKYELYAITENKLIYSRGFCTLYQEWQTTAEAKVMERSFYEVATMPYPRNKSKFVLSMRERDGSFKELYDTEVDPANYFIRKEKPISAGITRIYNSGDPATAVDLAFIAEGYTAGEMDKFRADVKKMADILFSEPPFSQYKDKINIWAVEAVSTANATAEVEFTIITAVQQPDILFLQRFSSTNSVMDLQDLPMNITHLQWLTRSFIL